MLPFLNNYTWIAILLAVMIYILKDWRKFKEFDLYMIILHISSFATGICVIDVLAGKPYLNKVIPNYMYTLLPATIVISLVCIVKINFNDIKRSNESYEEKKTKYRKQIKYIIGLLLACVWLYFSEYIGKYIVGPILTFIGLSK